MMNVVSVLNQREQRRPSSVSLENEHGSRSMAKRATSRQKARRTLQGRKTGPAKLGKRAADAPRIQRKQRAGQEPRLRAGLR